MRPNVGLAGPIDRRLTSPLQRGGVRNEGVSVRPCTPLILFAGLGLAACNPPTAPQTSAPQICDPIGGESIFGYVPPCGHSGPPPSPQVGLTDTVSPGVVRAGDKFTAGERRILLRASGRRNLCHVRQQAVRPILWRRIRVAHPITHRCPR